MSASHLSTGILVVGGGIMGLAAAWHLGESGAEVVLVEQQGTDGGLGSSHGATRGLRYSYEDPAYARLAMHAETWWRYAERRSGVELLRMTGGLDLGHPDAPSFARTLATVRDLRLDHELLGPAQVRARFPAFALPDDLLAIHQPGAGLINAARARESFAALAREAGVRTSYATRVVGIDVADDLRVACRSPEGDRVVACDRVVVCAGAWTNEVLATIGGLVPARLPLSVLQCEPIHIRGAAGPAPEVLFFRHPDPPDAGHARPFLEGIYVQPQPSGFLGAPDDGPRIKVGRHGGVPIESPAGVIHGRDVEDHDAMLARVDVLPGFAGGSIVGTDTCLYTMTPDEGFILDFLDPGRRLFVAAGFSGHGFKFAPVIGRAIAELLLDGRTDYEVESMEIGSSG